jgi:hypothetical protein
VLLGKKQALKSGCLAGPNIGQQESGEDAMNTPMKVNFDDTQENWCLWGELVQHWICKRREKPDSTDKLINQMTAHGITGADVYGPNPRPVKFVSYGEDDPLVIELPTAEMVAEDQKTTHPGKPYPLPSFYDEAYDGSRKAFSEEVIKRFAAARVGEYTINMCM